MIITRIEIGRIPVKLPTPAFLLSMDFNNCTLYPDGYNESEVFLTAKKYTTVFNSMFQNQKIQTVIYDKYFFEFICDNPSLQIWKYSDLCTVYLEDNQSFDAKILDVTSERHGTSLFSYKITLQKNDTDLINYLESNYLIDNYSESDLNRIEFSYHSNIAGIPNIDFANGETWNLYTALNPIYLVENDEPAQTKRKDGTTITSANRKFKFIEFELFLDDTNDFQSTGMSTAQAFDYYASTLFSIENTKLPKIVLKDSTEITSIEQFIPATDEGELVGMRKRTIKMKFEVKQWYQFTE